MKPRNFILQSMQLQHTLLDVCFFHAYLIRLLEFVVKQRIDNLVDVFYGGVMHASRTTCLWVEGTFKYTTEDRRRNLTPIEI